MVAAAAAVRTVDDRQDVGQSEARGKVGHAHRHESSLADRPKVSSAVRAWHHHGRTRVPPAKLCLCQDG